MLSRADYVDALGTSSASVGGNTFNTKHIFPADHAFSNRDIRDASSGSEVNTSDVLSFADALIDTTTNWATTFSSTRYLEFDFNSPLAAGISVTAATFDFRMIPNASGETACYYFEVRRASTGTVLNTYGSSGSPTACITGATYNTTSTSIVADVSTTDIANDLRIRVYGKESNSKGMKVDIATATVTTAYSTSTLYQKIHTDAADGSAATTIWGLTASGDGTVYLDNANWATSFSSSHYIKFSYPSYVPNGATITSVTFSHSYKSNTSGPQSCYYFEVYDGATLLGTHGSSSTPVSCATTSFVTDSVSLPEVNTVAHANAVTIKMYMKNSGSNKSQHDLASLTINYSVD